jgi:hypothetical protein
MDEDTDPEVGDDVVTRQEASSAAKPRRKTRAAAVAKQSASTAAPKVEAAKTAKLEAEKKKKRKRKMSLPLAVETPVIPTPPSREVESDEEDEATDDPPVVEDRTVRRSLSPAAKRQWELEQKTMEDDLRQGLEAQRAAAGAHARMLVLIKGQLLDLKPVHRPL